MATISLSGSDTIVINERVLVDFADQNVAELTFPNEIAALKTGKNGNVVYAQNETGRQADLALRVIMGSSDDKFLNNLWVQQQNNFSGFVLMTGQFTKKVGDGAGNITNIIYDASGGIFLKGIEAKTNVEGETDQSVAIYTMRFAVAPRAIG